ncbi:MAG TPA: hypothetical protein VMZ25_06440, partial [Terriglobales bacterium]|nr:hypothetical protein [Terriglobales bacterium]
VFERLMVRFSRRRFAVVVTMGILALALRLATFPWNPVPTPGIHDEFSYLLQAKTFDAGRITNVTHPMWVHFESFHINMKPTYQSMYPVGQASFLVIGQALFNSPWAGVLISIVVMCSAITWMLQAWMPSYWALFGGLITVLRFAVFGHWINSYWGGAVAAIGGALLFGAMGRLKRDKNIVRNSLIFAAGLAILANTRPFEGFVFSLIPLGWMACWLYRQFQQTPPNAYKALACGLVVLIPVFSGMLYYNYRSTGNPLLLPYAVNHQTYHISKPFLWQQRYPFPDYNHFIMKKFYIFHELPDYLNIRQPGGLAKLTASKVHLYYDFFIWPLGIAFIPAVWFAAKSQRWRLPFLSALLVFLALLVQLWPPHGHYAAPATCVIVAFLVLIIRLARTVRIRDLGLGVGLSRGLIAASMVVGGLWYVGSALNVENLNPFIMRMPPDVDRARVVDHLEKTPGKHLIIVKTNYFSWPGFDWVYNEPDIDGSKIVWARDMGDRNQEVLDYFKDRQVWEINVDYRILRAYAPPPSAGPQFAAATDKNSTATLQSGTPSSQRIHAK